MELFVVGWRASGLADEKAVLSCFDDFDGEGRTDVVAKNGDNLMVSWSGVSDWEQLNPNPISAPLSDLAKGNFTGDERDSIFWADGKTRRLHPDRENGRLRGGRWQVAIELWR